MNSFGWVLGKSNKPEMVIKIAVGETGPPLKPFSYQFIGVFVSNIEVSYRDTAIYNLTEVNNYVTCQILYLHSHV